MIDRQEWLEARRKGIGGTDAAAILGLSRWRSAIDVWEDKLGIAPERPQTAAMRWGLRLEDAIANAFTEETGIAVRKVGLRRAAHVRTFPMIGSVDRETYAIPTRRDVVEPAIVELKTARTDDGFAGADEWRDLVPEKRVPPGYYVQIQHYLELRRRALAYCVVLIGGSDLRIIEIPADPDFGADLVVELGDFWHRYVETGEQPPVGPDDLGFLSRKYPRDAGTEIVATSELSMVLDAYLAAVDDVERAEALRDGYRAKIEDAMGLASRLVSGSAVVSWKAHEVNATTWKAYAEALEQILAAEAEREQIERDEGGKIYTELAGVDLARLRMGYMKTRTDRPFRVTRNKEGAK